MTILKSETTDHGICLIDTYRAPGDLFASWDIVKQASDGSFHRQPNAGYGPESRDVEGWDFEPCHVTETYEERDVNGWTKRETTIYANGQVVANHES